MRLYTGRGDQGDTDLMGGSRVSKDHDRIEAIGEVDELNASLGEAIAALPADADAELLGEVQNDLFTIGAELALPTGARPAKAFTPLGEARITVLEAAIERLREAIGPQKAFVLPGGSREAALLHRARAVARRAERRVVTLAGRDEVNPEILRYLNRLSSLLHAMALRANQGAGVEERHPHY